MSNGKKLFHSRMIRKEEKRNVKKAFIFGGLTIILLISLVFLGIPALIKAAVFLSDLKKTNLPIEQTDTIPPNPPRFNLLPEFTKEQIIIVNGFAEAASTIELFLNDTPAGTVVADKDGSFTFTKVTLNDGASEIYTISTDSAENKSQPSVKSIVVFDNTPPKLEITSPTDSASITGERKRKIKITGQTDEDIQLTINDRLAIIGPDGSFSFEYNLADGENVIKAVALDQAGNQTEKEIKISFTP